MLDFPKGKESLEDKQAWDGASGPGGGVFPCEVRMLGKSVQL